MLVLNAQPRLLSEFLRDVLLALSFVLLVAVWFFLKRFPGWLRSLRGSGWPTAQGTVESATVNTIAEQSLSEIAYSYALQGERYSGYFVRQFADEQDAWDYARPLAGQPISVRYKPASPAVSAVRIEEQNPLFAGAQKSFALRLISRSVLHLFGGVDWREFTVFAASNWPISKGRIESGTVTQKRARDLWYLVPFYLGEITYSYAVGGQYYSGYLARTFFRANSARRFADELKGKEVLVRYKPDSPEISALHRRDQEGMPL
jgi:hypothetical protein